jgi:hypothetical protein
MTALLTKKFFEACIIGPLLQVFEINLTKIDIGHLMHLLICKRHGLLCIYNKKTIVVKPSICNTTMVLAGKVHLPKHTYLAQGTP